VLELSKKYFKININDLKEVDIVNLQSLIKYHSDLYYNKDEPIISDTEYDDLFKKLEYLEWKYEVSFKQTSLVWAELLESSFDKVKHSRPMISLDNTYNNDDLNDFHDRVLKNWELTWSLEYTLEFKFDWLGIELIYSAWELVQAITRGNWVEWEDVTANIMQIDNIPKKISYLHHLEVRGEVVMPISSFNELNEKAKNEWKKVFSNPRNAASWSVRMKDALVTKQRKLKFFAYDLANFEEFRHNENIDNYYSVIKDIEKLWFEISSYFNRLNWIHEVISAIENFWDVKSTIDFEIDWLVLKVNDINLWDQIGWTEHHPRYAIAYKFPAEIFTTKILSIEHSVWRTWAITPVANLEPVNMGWAVIRRATLHNYEEVEKLDVKIGDSVFIKRAWEVIPKIISVIKNWDRDNLEKIFVPEFCPSCETKVLKDEWKVRYYCPNNVDCPAKNSEKLAFAVGKQWFNIDWFWERQVELFLELWIIHNLVDIFKISEKAEEILELEWFKEKSVQNLIKWVEDAKKVEIATLLTALWIAWVGKKTAKTLAKLFESKHDLLLFTSSEQILEGLWDIWPEIAKNVTEYFSSDAHNRILTELVEILDITYFENKAINSNSIFAGKKVCITWSFVWDDWKKISRDDLVKQLEESGWDFMSSVSKVTDYLVAWEKAWSKLKKANDLWVKVIDLTIFYKSL